MLDGLSVTAGYRYTHDELSQATYFIAPPYTGGTGKWNYGSLFIRPGTTKWHLMY